MIALFVVLCTAVFTAASSSGHEKKDLNVSINVTYSPPSSFNRDPPFYQVGSALTLTCVVDGVTEGVFFEWTSDCKGATCFGLGSFSSSISKKYLESKDSGTHTCIVSDILGCSGNASIEIKVVGIGIYVTQGHQSLPNDGLIIAQSVSNRISEFRCLSGGTQYNVGQFIGVDGVDIVRDFNDPFFISRGTQFSPGVIHVRNTNELQVQYEGIYTCQMPDETGSVANINVGLYRNGTKAPVVTGIDLRVEGLLHSLVCNSTGSPATNVLWTYNNEPLPGSVNNSQFSLSDSKVVIERRKSSYSSILNINGTFENIVGQYSCQVKNQLGTSNKVLKEIKGLYISGSEKPIIVGLSRTVNCSTHLDISLMEWYLVGIHDDPVEQTTDSQTLSLTLTPKNVGLNGAMLSCRVTTSAGKVFEETVTVQVKELTNTVTITGDENPQLAGERYTLECTVESGIASTVRWKDGTNLTVTNSSEFLIEGPITEGITTVLRLTFLSLATSHGGVYYCDSTVTKPPSIMEESRELVIKIPNPRVRLIKSPSDDLLYTTTPLNITCIVEVMGVDSNTTVSVDGSLSGPAARTINNTVDIFQGQLYESSLSISSLQSVDSGTYTCSFSVSSPSPYVEESDEVLVSATVQAALKVSVVVSYASPDQYPTYSSPHFRAASSVTLRCIAEGTTGSVSYRWSSTCSSCFASNSYSSSISEQFLRSKDSGHHTCTATDAAGNSGSDTQQMIITGAGIYVSTSSSYGGSSSSQPNNTYIDYRNPSEGSDYFSLYCCSGSRSSSIGSITIPSGYIRTRDFDNIYDIQRYNSYDSYAGCIRFKATKICRQRSTSYYYPYHSTCQTYYNDPTNGVYSCNIQDENGLTRNVGFTLFSSVTYPRISSFSRVHFTNTFTLSCVTYQAPPTSLTWRKDGMLIDIDGTTHRIFQTVTNRHSVYYQNKLEIFGHLDNVTGSYTCEVRNKYYYYSLQRQYLTVSGIQVVTPASRIRVGQLANIACSSDLDPTSITWYEGNGTVVRRTTSSTNQMSFNPVSTDDEGKTYRCQVNSNLGYQEKNITLRTYVPDNWATVQITGHEGVETLHGNNYTLRCTVTLIRGITLPVTIDWMYNNVSIIPNGQISVYKENTSPTATTLVLTFSPIETSSGGEYSCTTSVHVPWMDQQPSVISESVHIPVTTQAMFQLKMGPLQHCVDWQNFQTVQLEGDIKNSLEIAIRKSCDCDFENTAIYSGEFSCQTTTTDVIYRAIINGTSDILPASQLMDLIETWRTTGGTLLYNRKFRLRLAQKEDCPLQVESFHEPECLMKKNVSSLVLSEIKQADHIEEKL